MTAESGDSFFGATVSSGGKRTTNRRIKVNTNKHGNGDTYSICEKEKDHRNVLTFFFGQSAEKMGYSRNVRQ